MIETNKIYNANCYDILKTIPDKSIDCIYIDPPYLLKGGGAGSTEISKRKTKSKMELLGCGEYFDPNLLMSENLRIAQNKINACDGLLNSDITNGFDYKTFIDEAFRIMKKPNMFIWCSRMQIRDILNYIYIYIYIKHTRDFGMV